MISGMITAALPSAALIGEIGDRSTVTDSVIGMVATGDRTGIISDS